MGTSNTREKHLARELQRRTGVRYTDALAQVRLQHEEGRMEGKNQGGESGQSGREWASGTVPFVVARSGCAVAIVGVDGAVVRLQGFEVRNCCSSSRTFSVESVRLPTHLVAFDESPVVQIEPGQIWRKEMRQSPVVIHPSKIGVDLRDADGMEDADLQLVVFGQVLSDGFRAEDTVVAMSTVLGDAVSSGSVAFPELIGDDPFVDDDEFAQIMSDYRDLDAEIDAELDDIDDIDEDLEDPRTKARLAELEGQIEDIVLAGVRDEEGRTKLRGLIFDRDRLVIGTAAHLAVERSRKLEEELSRYRADPEAHVRGRADEVRAKLSETMEEIGSLEKQISTLSADEPGPAPWMKERRERKLRRLIIKRNSAARRHVVLNEHLSLIEGLSSASTGVPLHRVDGSRLVQIPFTEEGMAVPICCPETSGEDGALGPSLRIVSKKVDRRVVVRGLEVVVVSGPYEGLRSYICLRGLRKVGDDASELLPLVGGEIDGWRDGRKFVTGLVADLHGLTGEIVLESAESLEVEVCTMRRGKYGTLYVAISLVAEVENLPEEAYPTGISPPGRFDRESVAKLLPMKVDGSVQICIQGPVSGDEMAEKGVSASVQIGENGRLVGLLVQPDEENSVGVVVTLRGLRIERDGGVRRSDIFLDGDDQWVLGGDFNSFGGTGGVKVQPIVGHGDRVVVDVSAFVPTFDGGLPDHQRAGCRVSALVDEHFSQFDMARWVDEVDAFDGSTVSAAVGAGNEETPSG